MLVAVTENREFLAEHRDVSAGPHLYLALLLAGLMLLLLAFLHARDAALRRIGGETNKTS